MSEHAPAAEFNLALGRPTRQSSGDADGSRSGAAVSGVFTGSFSFSTSEETNPWWEVDLGAIVPIGRIVLWNRDDAGLGGYERARPLHILLSDDGEAWRTILTSRTVFGGRNSGKPLVFDSLLPLYGRFLRVQLERHGHLHLDQVEVFLSQPPLRWAAMTEAKLDAPRVIGRARLWHDAGFFSNCSTTLESLVHLQAWGIDPAAPDCNAVYLGYREHGEARDIHAEVFAHRPAIALPGRDAIPEPFALFYAGHNHLHYRDRDFATLRPFLERFFMPGPRVRALQERLTAGAGFDPARSVAICWRGTDKHLEVQPADIGEYIALADRLLRDGKADRVLIQTDQSQARDAVAEHFGPRCVFFDELPVSAGDRALHHTDLSAEHGLERVEFARRLVAAMDLVAQAKHVITHTGNVGLWIALFRRSAERLWQFDRDRQLIPPPGAVAHFAYQEANAP